MSQKNTSKGVKKLNKSQESFCREYVISNNNARKAYEKAYPSEKRSDKATDASASRLLRNVKVKEYISTLQKEAQEKFEITRDTQVKHLETIRKKMMNGEGDYRVAIKAIEEQSKLLGLYEPEKQEITAGQGTSIEMKFTSAKKNR